MGGLARGAGGDPGAGRDGGAPRSGGAAGADAATAGGAGRGGAAGGRAGGAGDGRAASGGALRAGDGGGTDTSLAGRLVTSLWRSGVGMTGGGAAGAGPLGAGAPAAGAGEAGPGASVPVEAATAWSAGTRPGLVVVARAGFCSAGSSGETARRNPSLSAFLRTRSAWASSIEEEWLFTPMPNDTQRSRASLLVRPSSRASS
jgi:hypothetical protein